MEGNEAQKYRKQTIRNIMAIIRCVVPENIHNPTTEEIGNSRKEGAQRPRKFQRQWGVGYGFSFQKPFDSILIGVSI